MHEDVPLPNNSLAVDETLAGDIPTLGDFDEHDHSRRRSEGEMLGRRLGRYLIMRKLGEGGMGQVYEAYDEELDRRVAIKLLHAKPGHDEVLRGRMQREARAMAKISHPNVVAVHDVGSLEGGHLFVAMEFVRGQTLRRWQDERGQVAGHGRRELLDLYIQAGQGLAAAHEHGLIHRDFKPENVMVGEDGRVRVLDFGLVTPAGTNIEQSEEQPEITSVDSIDTVSSTDSPSLTRTGSILGTPMFMAAEQFLGEPTDERTDQFNFCASLYHALYNMPAFEGDSVPALMAAVLDGRMRPPPTGRDVPDWLRAVVVRGLAHDPSERHPSMAALLSALSVDPIARRRRRLAMLAAVVVLIGVSVALVLGGLRVRERWQQREREDAALARLEALDAAIERHPESGRAAFESYVGHPDNWGTQALAQAWLHEAERAEEQPDRRVGAYAQAYVVSTDDETRSEALLGLARHFRHTLRWHELSRALTLLEGYPALEGDIESLRLDSLFARREMGAASKELSRIGAEPRLQSIAKALGRGRPSDYPSRIIELLDPEDESLTLYHGNKALIMREAEDAFASLPMDSPLVSDAVDKAAGARGPLIVQSVVEPGKEREAVLSRVVGDQRVELFRWNEQVLTSSLAHDLDGDGVREFYVGTGPYTRRLVELAPDGAGSWSTRFPAPILDREGSDITGLAAADLDGDGRDELVVAHGPWTAYGIRVLRRSRGAATLESVARARLGFVSGMALVDHRPQSPGGVEIVTLISDYYKVPKSFQLKWPEARELGLLGFRFRDGKLELARTITAPRVERGVVLNFHQVFVADLDGDGRDEVVVNSNPQLHSKGEQLRAPTLRQQSWIFALNEDGSHSEITILQMNVVGAYDMDGDGDDELLVHYGDKKESWILGTGEQTPPTVDVVAARKESREIADPVLADMWQRAEELAAMSLDAEAADSFASFAAQIHDPALEARALQRAGQLLEGCGEDLEAARLYGRAARATARPDAEAAVAAAGTLRRRGDLHAALDEIDTMSGTAALDSMRRTLERLVSPGFSHTIDFDEPLAGWRIDSPLSLRRDRLSGTLHVGAHRSEVLLARSVRWDGELFLLEVDIDFERGGWDSKLMFGLVDNDGKSVVSLELQVQGGSSDLSYDMLCNISDKRHLVLAQPAPAGPPGRRTLRLVWDRVRGEGSCSLRDRDGHEQLYRRFEAKAGELSPGHELLLRSTSSNSGLSTTLHRISVNGVEFSPVEVQPAPAAVALVEGEHLDVLREARETRPEEQLWRVVALTRLAQVSAAAEALARLAEDPEAWKEVEPSVVALMRSDPTIYGAVLELAVGADRRMDLLERAWMSWFGVGDHDSEALRVMLDGLAELERSPSVQRFTLRAMAQMRIGAHARAAADYQSALDLHLAENGEGPAADRLRVGLANNAVLSGDEHRARALVEELLASPERAASNAEVIADSRLLAPLVPGASPER